MSGEGGCLPMPRAGRRQLPEPGEARALADELREMMAAGQLDQGVLRRAANALDAVGHCDATFYDGLLDADVTGDPFGGQILSSFEGGEHGDHHAIDRCQ